MASVLAALAASAYGSGNQDLAINLWKAGLRARSGDPAFHINLGSAYYNRGDLDRAKTHWEQAYQMTDDDPDLLSNLVLLYRRRGKPEMARDILLRALRLRIRFR